MPRRRAPEPDAPLDRWVISWADFLTLLFAFFVVMYAVSSVNEEKYRSLTDVLTGVFAGQGGVPGKSASMHQGAGVLPGGESLNEAPATTVNPVDSKKTRELNQLRAKLASDFSAPSYNGLVEVSGNDLWFSIELRSSLLFDSGGALPAVAADKILAKIAARLKGTPNPVHVEGFTDNQPISTDQFPSNWELSAARAAAVVRLLANDGVEPQRMAAVGFGEYQPAYSNRTARGRQLNRRIVIVVSRDEKVRRSVASFGSHDVSADAVSAMLTKQSSSSASQSAPTIEQVETKGGVLYRQASPEQQQE